VPIDDLFLGITSKAAEWKKKQFVLDQAGVSFALISDASSFSRSR
jgi:hypothetical protein